MIEPSHVSKQFEKKIEEARAARESSVDGFKRSDDLEERINIAFRNAFSGNEGELVMDYLKSITTQVILPPSASDAELRMQEGMRRLCGIIDARRRSTPK